MVLQANSRAGMVRDMGVAVEEMEGIVDIETFLRIISIKLGDNLKVSGFLPIFFSFSELCSLF